MFHTNKPLARLAALALFLIVTAGLIGQFYVSGQTPALAPIGPRLWEMLRYFTILANLWVCWLMARQALGLQNGPQSLISATLALGMVGVIFQLLLTAPEPFVGLQWWVDFTLHGAMPLLVVLWWLAFAPRPPSLRALPRWLIFPLAYCAYALIRGGVDGVYPYFFLDVTTYGWARILGNIAAFLMVFSLAGAGLWALGRAIGPR